ncbi:hypothetical protein ABZ137_26125 [Streptomyces bobili]|uniref:hypothetical protein n=1 Tax=Streptomyces bobili TaxID=67280 RepID=UPI0033A7CC6D
MSCFLYGGDRIVTLPGPRSRSRADCPPLTTGTIPLHRRRAHGGEGEEALEITASRAPLFSSDAYGVGARRVYRLPDGLKV